MRGEQSRAHERRAAPTPSIAGMRSGGALGDVLKSPLGDRNMTRISLGLQSTDYNIEHTALRTEN